ncbi:MAG: DnaJ C-terminal domain-containing protein [Bifidobacterium breve]
MARSSRLKARRRQGRSEDRWPARAPGINGGKAGDLYLHVTVNPDSTFSMRGRDIVMNLPVTGPPWPAARSTPRHRREPGYLQAARGPSPVPRSLRWPSVASRAT